MIIITQLINVTVKVFLFVDTNICGFYKIHWSIGSWICVFKQYRQQSMENCILLEFKWTTKIITPLIIMISQYIIHSVHIIFPHNSLLRVKNVILRTNKRPCFEEECRWYFPRVVGFIFDRPDISTITDPEPYLRDIIFKKNEKVVAFCWFWWSFQMNFVSDELQAFQYCAPGELVS